MIDLLTFSPDNTKLASYSLDGNVRMWDRATGACLQSLAFGKGYYCMSLTFSPDSSQLAIACEEFIKILDLNTGVCIMTLNNDPYYESIIFSPNGMQLILSNELWEDGSFRIWDLTTGMQLQKEDYYQDVREPAVFQIDTIDAPGEDEITVIRSPITGSRVQVVSKVRPEKVIFRFDGIQFALRAYRSSHATYYSHPRPIYILDAITGKCLQKFTEHSKTNNHWDFSPDGTRLATVDFEKGIRIWDVKKGVRLAFPANTVFGPPMAFSPDGTELASAAWDNSIRIWDITLGASVDPKEKESIWSVTYSPDGTRLALVKNFGGLARPFTIEIWDPVEGTCQQQLQVGEATSSTSRASDIAQLAFSPDNTQLAYSRGSEIAIRDLAANPQQNRLELKYRGSIQSIIFSPSGTRLALADIPTSRTNTPKIEIWDVINDRIVRIFYPLYPGVGVTGMRIHFSSDGGRLGSVSEDGEAAIWDLKTNRREQALDFNFTKTFRERRLTYLEVRYLRHAQSQCFITNMLQDPFSIYSAIHEFDLSTNKSWLLRRGEPFLRLPPEYRPKGMTFTGGNIAIVLSTNALLFFCFNLAKLDAEMASNRSSILKV